MSPTEQAAMLHHSQVFGGDVAGAPAGLGDLANRKFLLEHELHHSEPHGMREGSQAFGGLLEFVRRQGFFAFECLHVYIIS